MDLKIAKGKDFHLMGGPTSFDHRFDQFTKKTALKSILPHKAAFIKVLRGYNNKIRSGGLTDYDRERALLLIEHAAKHASLLGGTGTQDKSSPFTIKARHAAKKVLEHLAVDDKPAAQPEPKPEVKPVSELDAKMEAAAKVRSRLHINRDPSFSYNGHLNSDNPGDAAHTGLALSKDGPHSTSSGNRGQFSGAGLSSGRVDQSQDGLASRGSGLSSRQAGKSNLGSKPGGLGSASAKRNLLSSLN